METAPRTKYSTALASSGLPHIAGIMKIDAVANDSQPMNCNDYSLTSRARVALEALAGACSSELPLVFRDRLKAVTFTASSTSVDMICFPCPLKEQDLGSALKALEGCVVAFLADVRYGHHKREINVDVGKTTCFLMSAYLTTLDGMGKGHTKIKYRLPGWSPPS